MSDKKTGLTTFYVPVLVLLLIAAAFYVGRLSSQVDGLKKGVAGTDTAVPTPTPEPERPLDVGSLKMRANNIGLDIKMFDECLDTGKMAERVATEQKEGVLAGVSGTPSFMINGVMLVGAQPLSSFESVIDAELKNGTGDKAAAALGEEGKRQKLNLTKGYVTGPENAKIKIVEFTDFECPYCERAFPTVTAVLEKYKGNISMEYKSFPLSFHANAQKAAEAALCAGEQGKFWEMHDNLFAPAK